MPPKKSASPYRGKTYTRKPRSGGNFYKVVTYSPKDGQEIDRDEGLTAFQALTLAMQIREGEGGFIVHVYPPLPEKVILEGRRKR